MTTSVLFHTLPAAEAYARGEGSIHPIDDRLGDVIGFRVELQETERIKRLELEETERIKRLALDDAQLRLESDRSLHTEVLYGTLAKSVALGMEQTDHPRTRIVKKVAAEFGVSVRTVERAIAEERKRLAALRRPPTAYCQMSWQWFWCLSAVTVPGEGLTMDDDSANNFVLGALSMTG